MRRLEVWGSRFAGRHAVVVGGSMAGMLAARVLANHFAHVTLIEREVLQGGGELRAGEVRARHGHALLGEGLRILRWLFPGLVEDLLAHGAQEMDSAQDARWYQGGVWRCRFPSGMRVYGVSRPLLEARVRAHLLERLNVHLADGYTVRGLLAGEGGRRVTGVEVVRAGVHLRVEADLVVDASGRDSRLPAWLEALGCGAPPTTGVRTDVGYATRLYRRPAASPDWRYLLQLAPPPSRRRALLLPVEGGDRWVVTLCGSGGDHPPADAAGFLSFAQGLPAPDLAEALRDAEPLSGVSTARMPLSVRRHYERMERFPDGLVVVGDAVCCVSSLFSQGLTGAALGAEVLDGCLRLHARTPGEVRGLSTRFQRQLARALDLPWHAALHEALADAEAEGWRGAATGIMRWYMGRILQLCAHDPEVMRRFLAVMHQRRPRSTLFNPRTVLRVLTAGGPAPARAG